MLVTLASEPGESGVNEDFAAVAAGAASAAVVLDGVSVPGSLETGCVHGTPWYVAHLGTSLLRLVTTEPATPLAKLLARSIADVTTLHSGTCDLTHPGTPAAAVAAIRWQPDKTIAYLVLSDITVIVDRGGAEPTVITDARVDETATDEWAAVLRASAGSADHAARRETVTRLRRELRNRPGGYWIANTEPAAAEHALTGHVAADDVRRIAVLTDGAARIVTLGLANWSATLDLLETGGPAAVIARVRQAERADPTGTSLPRGKPQDDATALLAIHGSDAGRHE